MGSKGRAEALTAKRRKEIARRLQRPVGISGDKGGPHKKKAEQI
jgi:hypothetical protein